MPRRRFDPGEAPVSLNHFLSNVKLDEGTQEWLRESFPIHIQAKNEWGNLVRGRLYWDGRVEVSGIIYPNPTAALIAVGKQGGNGWMTWSYRDDSSGKWMPIDSIQATRYEWMSRVKDITKRRKRERSDKGKPRGPR